MILLLGYLLWVCVAFDKMCIKVVKIASFALKSNSCWWFKIDSILILLWVWSLFHHFFLFFYLFLIYCQKSYSFISGCTLSYPFLSNNQIFGARSHPSQVFDKSRPANGHQNAGLAQLVARQSHNLKVVSSSLTFRIIFFLSPGELHCKLQRAERAINSLIFNQKYRLKHYLTLQI